MAEELLVVLNRDENTGFGFSLLGKPGLPPVIYNILDDSPAAESGVVEVGDVILKVNDTDVNRFTTKEVLKCLRLSSDPVTLKIKRDPKIKATVRKHLQSVSGTGINSDGENFDYNNSLTEQLINSSSGSSSSTVGGGNGSGNNKKDRPEPGVHHYQHVSSRTNGSCPEEEPLLSKYNNSNERLQWEPLSTTTTTEYNKSTNNTRSQPKFEAYMMTGEHILNISRVPQSASILPKQQKKIDSLRYHNSHTHHLRHQPYQQQSLYQHNSVPNSPNEMDLGLKGNNCRSGTNSANTSPISANKWGTDHLYPHHHHHHHHHHQHHHHNYQQQQQQINSNSNSYVRTSRSEDQLQGGGQNDLNSDMNTVNIDVDDEDITSSLNTLLDTRPDSCGGGGGGGGNNAATSSSGDSDRIVWTYNAPVTTEQQHKQFCHTLSNGSSSSHNSNTSPTSSSSPLHSGCSPAASPTSVSSSVMSSQSSSKRIPTYNNTTNSNNLHQYSNTNNNNNNITNNNGPTNGDFSVSEAISNISSPDYHDDDSMGIRDCVMEISDYSDSDSTLLVSEPRQRHNKSDGGSGNDHRIVIQVKGPDKDNVMMKDRGKGMYCDNRYQSSNDASEPMYDDEETATTITKEKSSSPQSSEDESDVESLHSFHYSPKAVDLPSAIRLAKRLYCLDGFKKSDVSRHLSKNNDFSRAVAEEYLKYFSFENDTLDIALRKFLKQFSLTGETQERERVLVHFSKRYLDCNPGSFNSQDAVHTLTCAIMLLNTDLHGQNVNRKMTCNEFIENLAGLNECENFPRDVLKQLYHAIKNYPLEWALDEENEENNAQMQMKNTDQLTLGNPFLDVPVSTNAIEYKKGYVMRKCCYEAHAKRTPFHKRSWKMFYCTLRDLVLYLHKDENGFRKNQISDNLHNAIRIHHALATKANDYTKKQYVFRLQTADQAEYLFQTSDSKELQSWIDTINFVCASFSAPPLEAAVGSQKKFQRPLLPCSLTKLNLREQLRDHEERVLRLEAELEEHRKSPPEKGSKSLIIQNYKEKEAYLNYEVKRYRTYAYMLRSKMSQYPDLSISLVENSIGEVDDETTGSCNITLLDSGTSSSSSSSNGSSSVSGGNNLIPPPIPERPSPSTNRRNPE